MGTHRRRPAGLPRHPRPAQGRSRAAATRPGPARPGRVSYLPGGGGRSPGAAQACVLEGKQPSGRAAGAPGTREAQRDVPGPRRAAEPDQGQGERGRSSGASKPSPGGPREGNKGAGDGAAAAAAAGRPHRAGIQLRARRWARPPGSSRRPSPPTAPSAAACPPRGPLTPARRPKAAPVPLQSRPRAEPGPAAAFEFPGSRRPRRSSQAGGTGKAAARPSPSSAGTR